jgi:hypothetical protein
VSYEPSELVVTVRAGTPLAELEQLLAEHGNACPLSVSAQQTHLELNPHILQDRVHATHLVHTMPKEIETARYSTRPTHRAYTPQFKAEPVAQCQLPGASIASL